jgi:hypothetical protein
MNCDDFENRLRQQRFRPLPGEWREQVLRATRAQTEPRPAAAHWRDVVREWFWPHPVAWAGLAATWVLLAVLQWQPEAVGARPVATTSAGGVPVASFVEMRRELSDLLEPKPSSPPRPEPARPLRRTELVVECHWA